MSRFGQRSTIPGLEALDDPFIVVAGCCLVHRCALIGMGHLSYDIAARNPSIEHDLVPASSVPSLHRCSHERTVES
ncbi:hypothetical protein ACFL59_06870 [Planctomycetota bacterium]